MNANVLDGSPWSYVIIVLTGWLATDMWRWLGVLAGSRLKDDSALLVWVRAMATALVAGVVAKLVLYPTGVLSDTPILLRIGATLIGFVAFLLCGKRIYVGILVALGCLLAGLQIWPLPPA